MAGKSIMARVGWRITAMERFSERMQKAGLLILAEADAFMREWQARQVQNVSPDTCNEPEDGG